MRGALVGRWADHIGQVRALVDRQLVAPGSHCVPLRLTPLGRQISTMLCDLYRQWTALTEIERLLAQGERRVDEAREVALRALSQGHGRWLP
jgi:hypothetical protein